MPTLPTLKQSLKRTLADNLGQCIQQLEASLDPNREAYNRCIATLTTFRRLEQENYANTVSRDDYIRELAQLTHATLALIDSLTENDLSEARLMREEIHERILIITATEQREQMERFFSRNFFKNISFINYGDAVPAERYALALLEDLNADSTLTTLMEKYLSDLPCYCLYFGKRFPLNQDQYAKKVYFANSIFSLYTRIREMLDFIKYYDREEVPGSV